MTVERDAWTIMREDLHNLSAHFCSFLNTLRYAVHPVDINFMPELTDHINKVIDDARAAGVKIDDDIAKGLTNATQSMLASANVLNRHIDPATNIAIMKVTPTATATATSVTTTAAPAVSIPLDTPEQT